MKGSYYKQRSTRPQGCVYTALKCGFGNDGENEELPDQPTLHLFSCFLWKQGSSLLGACSPRFSEVQPWTMLADPLPMGTDWSQAQDSPENSV